MNRKVQTKLIAVLIIVVFSATATYVTVNFDSFWIRDEAERRVSIKSATSEIGRKASFNWSLSPQPLSFLWPPVWLVDASSDNQSGIIC